MAITTIEEAIYSNLSTHAGLIALVPAVRIKPNMLPQDCIFPAIVFYKVATERFPAMGWNVVNKSHRVFISCHTTGIKEARKIVVQVRDAMQRWTGTYGSITVDDCFYENESSSWEPDIDDYQITLEFLIWYR